MGMFDGKKDAEVKEEAKVNVDSSFFSSEDTAEGFEDINMDTMAVPFIKIAQALSPALNKNKPEYIEGLEAGDFYNSVTNEVLGKNIEVIVMRYENVFSEWLPDRGGFVSSHTPLNAKAIAADLTFGKWMTADGNSLVENYTYLVLIAGREQEGPAVLVLASSNIKVAKKWNRMLVTHVMDNGKRALPYYLRWILSTEYTENNQGSWYGLKVAPAKQIYIDKVQYDTVKTERKLLPERQIDYAQLESGTENVKQISNDQTKDLETKF